MGIRKKLRRLGNSPSGPSGDSIKIHVERRPRSPSSLIRTVSLRASLSLDDLVIKVAIIDNGVDPWQPDIAANVKGGISFERDECWYTPRHAHGTYMASLMKRINPLVHIYAYRVTSGDHGLPVKKAAEVMNSYSLK
jgi:hypothetical protein